MVFILCARTSTKCSTQNTIRIRLFLQDFEILRAIEIKWEGNLVHSRNLDPISFNPIYESDSIDFLLFNLYLYTMKKDSPWYISYVLVWITNSYLFSFVRIRDPPH